MWFVEERLMISPSASDVSIGFFIAPVLAGIRTAAFDYQLKSTGKSFFKKFAIADSLFRN
jgi:hypothetical protein